MRVLGAVGTEFAKQEFAEAYLVRLTAGGSVLRLTTWNETLTYSSVNWSPREMVLGPLNWGAKIDAGDTFDFSLANVDLAISALIANAVFKTTQVEVFVVAVNKSTGAVEGGHRIFNGTMDRPRISKMWVRFTPKSYANRIEMPFLTRKFEPHCPWIFADAATCGVTNTGTSATVSAWNGTTKTLTVTIGSPPATGMFDVGFASFTSGDWSGKKVFVRSYTNPDTVVLDYAPAAGDPTGSSVTLFKGCRKTLKDCNDRHSNKSKYGGFDAVPGQRG